MLARQRLYTASSGLQFQTPLLVPAFSSKGFKLKGRVKGKQDHYSEVAYPLDEFCKHPASAVLLSAFDLHFKHFDAPKIQKFSSRSHLQNTAVVFVDSGGYELLDDFDSTEPRIYPLPAEGKQFALADYLEVLNGLAKVDPPPPLMLANFDHGSKNTSVADQVVAARRIFQRYGMFASDFILKPWTPSGRVVDPRELSQQTVSLLRGFDVIGVTEKELGTDLWDKLSRVAALRAALDRAGIDAPIHIWGGLDPVISPLFYFAGAEIFDGVSWLRYAYMDGVAVCREAFGPLLPELGVASPASVNLLTANIRNVAALSNLTDALIEWHMYEGARFDMFDQRVRDTFLRAYRVMMSKMAHLREAQ